MVVLGQGEPEQEHYFKRAAKRYPKQVSANIKFDAGLAQRIYAGSDIFLVPSRFEPCGLTQMIAMRYGALPLVRDTGGLHDTVSDGETGFVFKNYQSSALLSKIKDALKIYRDNPQKWRSMQKRAMHKDFSWQKSAQEYLKIYQQLCGK